MESSEGQDQTINESKPCGAYHHLKQVGNVPKMGRLVLISRDNLYFPLSTPVPELLIGQSKCTFQLRLTGTKIKT